VRRRAPSRRAVERDQILGAQKAERARDRADGELAIEIARVARIAPGGTPAMDGGATKAPLPS
jgi:hypothetical protein